MGRMIDDSVRATSFGVAARSYDRYRVGPPPEIVARITAPDCRSVVDLGAGTGAMTRQLMGRIPHVTAVEPDSRMRSVLAENCPGVTVLEGTAEQLPLPVASVDAVVVASAWHWMDPQRAIPEIARVLKDSGTLALVWNRRDRTVPWVADLESFRREVTRSDDKVEKSIRHYLEEPWLPEDSPFTDIEISALPWRVEMTRSELCGMLTTFTGYITAPDDRKPEILREFTAYVDADARLGAGETVEVPMLCHYWRARRS
jgi:SAM-dependent methyltransferase